jgi:hypothetical protein
MKNDLLPSLARSSPLLLTFLPFINLLLYPGFATLYLFIVFLLLFPLNWILKNFICKPIYNYFQVIELPLIGRGDRPPNAYTCGIFLDNGKSMSFGMPSGHSQIAWAVGTYIIYLSIIKIYELINNNSYINFNSNDKFSNDIIKNNSSNDIIKNNSSNEKDIYTIFLLASLVLLVILVLISMIYISYSRVFIDGCHTIEQVIVGAGIGIIYCVIVIIFY